LEVGQWAQPGATLAKVVEPDRLKAVLKVPETLARDIAPGQDAKIDTRNGVVDGSVIRIDPSVLNGTVAVHVALVGPLPRGARPDLTVEGTVQVEQLTDVTYLRRPAYSQPNSTMTLFRLSSNGSSAERVGVRLGRSSADTIEVIQGLEIGDRIVVSDMSRWERFDRIRLN
jgi:hypothetical protein